MIINASAIASATRGFQAVFQRGFDSVAPMYAQVATTVPSSTLIEDYGWIGDIPGMREWVGDRQIHNLTQHEYSIRNKDFELTVGVDRNRFEDDQYGIFSPMMESLGYEARIHPDKLVFALLALLWLLLKVVLMLEPEEEVAVPANQAQARSLCRPE